MSEAAGWAAGLMLLGLIVGSFVGALVVRWPQGRSVVTGRSRCDACDRPLRARDMVPLLSFALLRGRCRDCGGAIDRQHPAIEAIGGAIGLAAGWAVGGPWAVAGAAFGWLLLALGALDLAALWLPNRLVALLAREGAK